MNAHDPCTAVPATGVSRKLLTRLDSAARRVPPSPAVRLEEEWLADMAARRSAFAHLRLAIGFAVRVRFTLQH